MIEKFSHNFDNTRGNPTVNEVLQQFLVVFELPQQAKVF